MVDESRIVTVTDALGMSASKTITLHYSEWVTARYWRLYITAQVGTDNWMNLRQIALRATPGGVNQCIGAGGTADQNSVGVGLATYTAIHAFEETLATDGDYWHSGVNIGGPWWASFDFGAGARVQVAELALTTTNAIPARGPKDFSLQFSRDGVNWLPVATYSGIVNWTLNVSQSFAIPPIA